MTRVLIIGGGIAGPVTAMALQRAGIDAVVYEAHPPTDEEVGSYLTVASNGIDALRAIDADRPVLHAGFPTPTNLALQQHAPPRQSRLPLGTRAMQRIRIRLARHAFVIQ